MAKFPVEYSNQDSESVVDAVNYAISGPGGTGQNFSGFSDSFTAWLIGNVRTPSTIAGYVTPAHGASGASTITVSDPGSIRQDNPDVPSKIEIGMYVLGTNIGAGAQVAGTYDQLATPWLVPLTVANTGAVQGAASFYQSQPLPLYVAPIAINTITWTDARTLKVLFTAAQPSAPFSLGSLPQIVGNTKYNGYLTGPGVVECTTTYVILQSSNDITDVGTGTGGTIKLSSTQQPPTVGVDPGFPTSLNLNTTDCSGIVTVNGNLDRVFISAQIDNTLSYTATAGSTIEYTVAINRYKGTIPTVRSSLEVQYYFDETVALQTYNYTVGIGSAILPLEETIFTNIIDIPVSGYYLYRIELLFRIINDTGAAEITQSQLGNRSIGVQVVKQ